MAKIRGYINEINVLDNKIIDTLNNLIGDIFPIIDNTSITNYLILSNSICELRLHNYSGGVSNMLSIHVGNTNMGTNAVSGTGSITFGKFTVFETKDGIIMTLGSQGNSASQLGSVVNVAININNNTACVSSSVDYNYNRSNYFPKEINAYVSNGTTLNSYPISSTGIYMPGQPLSPYPVVTEIVHDNEHTGIYALTQGQLMNATVSDGEKNIFISNVLGLED